MRFDMRMRLEIEMKQKNGDHSKKVKTHLHETSLQRHNPFFTDCENRIQMMKQLFTTIEENLFEPRTDLLILVV